MKFDVWKDTVSQSSYLNSRPDPVTYGGVGGNLKSWKTLRVEGSERDSVVKISTSPRYVIDITGMDPLSLGESGGRVNSKKIEKIRYF